MAAPIQSNDDGVISSINIIPFVDIVLVLLIIFMVTSTAIVKAAIKVDLPQAAAAGSEVASTVNIVLTLNGELALNGEAVTSEQAANRLKSMTQAEPDLQAVISADKKLPYGRVVEVVDLVKLSGVRTFALNIERKTVARK